MMVRISALVTLVLLTVGCAGRTYSDYLTEPAPAVHPAFVASEGTALRPYGAGSNTSMTVSWAQGDVRTEVQIPMLSSGQRIVIEHASDDARVGETPLSHLTPPAPRAADAVLERAYRDRGLDINDDAAPVSLTGARERMQDAVDADDHAQALEWAELVLHRYPEHPEMLRAKGSLLLLLGELDAAIDAYEAAQDVEPDAAVQATLDELTATPRR